MGRPLFVYGPVHSGRASNVSLSISSVSTFKALPISASLISESRTANTSSILSARYGVAPSQIVTFHTFTSTTSLVRSPDSHPRGRHGRNGHRCRS